MDVHASLEAICDPDVLFGFVDDLAKYPDWMDLVHAAVAVPERAATWDTELRARLGPLARSKRLRMVRTEHDPDRRIVRFERREDDGREHSPWILSATVSAELTSDAGAAPCVLDVGLHYGGALWTGGLLERALAEQISRGRQRLVELVSPTR